MGDEQIGMVSMWLGTCTSEASLTEALRIRYSQLGECGGSRFARAFGITAHDEDFQEASMVDPSLVLADLLDGFSYSERIASRFAAVASVAPADNAVVLLYNFQYSGELSSWSWGGVSLRYAGCVRYAK